MFWIGLLVGLPVGGTFGLLTFLLFLGASDSDREELIQPCDDSSQGSL